MAQGDPLDDPDRLVTIREFRELAATLGHDLTREEQAALGDEWDPEEAHADFANYARAMAARRKRR